MARKASNSMSSRLTRFETIAGWLYRPFYLIILNLLLQLANEKLSLGMSALTINIAYFAINLAATLLIFHGFLRQSYFGGSFWNFVQAVVLGFALYYAGTWVLQFALTKLAPGFTIYNNETVGSLISDNEYIMMAVTIILAPVIEETLVRGLVFGSIRPTSSPSSYSRSCTTGSISCSIRRGRCCSAVFRICPPPLRWPGPMKRPAPSGRPSRCMRSSTRCRSGFCS